MLAARRLFAQRGYRVPLSVIAKEAGVGQAVLYRNFPSRQDLAAAVFEDNFAELQVIAADPDPGSFFRLWERLIDMTITDSAFVEMMVEARRSDPYVGGRQRLTALLEPTIRRARDAGLVAPELTADEVLLAHRLAYGLVVTATSTEGVRASIDAAFAMLAARWPWSGTATCG